jgi:UDP-2,3-diacylglucosamine pyrophosphatase LpxH
MAQKKTTRRIFISDIHMGDKRSINSQKPHHPYCWFYDESGSSVGDRPEMLTAFLNEYCAHKRISEVIILGDLFDEWICPSECDPTDPSNPMPPSGKQFINVAESTQNKQVIAALTQLASKIRLKYMPGNHDMLAERTIIEQILPNIEYVSTQVDGHPVYQADGIWAEHGHWYGLFNAPYPDRSGSGFDASILPLGFFVSRLAAESAFTTGRQFGPTDIIKEWLKHIFTKVPATKTSTRVENHGVRDEVDDILGQLFDTMVRSYANGKDPVMNGFDGVPGSLRWKTVKDRYANIFAEWSNSHPNNVGHVDAIRSDSADLWPAACFVSFRHDDARIIIFGHTHECTFSSNVKPDDPSRRPLPGAQPLYANSGAWCRDAAHCTFVETVFDPSTGKHSVQPKEWARKAGGSYAASNYGYGGWVTV